MPGGFSLRIFLPDGSPDGLRVVDNSNCTERGGVWLFVVDRNHWIALR